MTASIRIVVYPLDGDVVDDLVRDADTVMYAAKQAGRNNFQFFTPEYPEFGLVSPSRFIPLAEET